MNYKQKELEKTDILNATNRNKYYVEELSLKLIRYYSDPDRKYRRSEDVVCKCCHYINNSRIGGSAITTVNCSHCDTEITFGNTCVDKLCKECAAKLKLCSHCGAKLD